jgi:uncharacterized protein YdeI (YjbR/CyaY-like superfamily)
VKCFFASSMNGMLNVVTAEGNNTTLCSGWKRLSQHIEQICQNWFVILKIQFCGMSPCSCRVELNVPFSNFLLQKWDDFLILSHELYIFVDIMKHTK